MHNPCMVPAYIIAAGAIFLGYREIRDKKILFAALYLILAAGFIWVGLIT